MTREDPGRYELDEELGRGGMGRVVLARDRHLGRDVAMKELLVQALQPDAAMSVGAVTRFLREARITGQLEHPSIVPVHELGQREDGTIYYTMQRIRGRSLARALREAATLAERLKLLGHFRDVCEAVAYAHSRGVVHRDLKPENVMVGEFGETLVVDWGLAKVKGESDPGASDIARRVDVLRGADASHTVDGHAIGTPAYMSPEQARGDLDAIDERSDVWGLGAMLFEILTGRPPYVGKSALEVLDKVVSEPAPRVRTIEERAPPELAAIADRALIHEPSSRYVGAKPIADEIAAFQDGGQVKAYQYGARERFVRFVRRHRAASTAVALVVVAVAVSTGLVGRAYRQSLGALRAAQESRAEAHAARAAATRRADDTALALADAWLERAEHALDTGDPAAAALYAASALVRAEAATEGASDRTRRTTERATDELARERVARARSLVLDAEAARRFVFARFVDGADHRAALSHDGRQLVVPSADGVSLHPTEGGAAREVTVSAPAAPPSQLVGFLGDDRAIARFDGPDGATAHAVISLLTGEREAMTFDGASALGVAPIRLALARANGEIELLHGDELAGSTDPSLRDVVERFAGGSDAALRDQARETLRTVSREPSELRTMGLDELSRHGTRMLGVAPPERLVPVLIDILADAPEGPRAAISVQWLEALTMQANGNDVGAWRRFWAEHRDRPHRAWCLEAAGSPVPLLRAQAFRALAAHDPSDDVRARLTAALDDPIMSVRDAAARTLLAWGDDAGLDHALRALESFSLPRRHVGFEMLSRFGDHALGYAPDASEEDRVAAIARWREWSSRR
ncbi:MAG: protein kinase [Myxococcales bacterium]|nr:protein kinase [Myxococcales bacterium]